MQTLIKLFQNLDFNFDFMSTSLISIIFTTIKYTEWLRANEHTQDN